MGQKVQTQQEWEAGRLQRAAAAREARKAEADRVQRLNAELDEELAIEAQDPTYRRRKRLKALILDLINLFSSTDGPVLRSRVYETLNGGRHKDIFSQAIDELLEAGVIIKTERRDGIRGRIGVAYLPAPH
jgi:hypothetical protein